MQFLHPNVLWALSLLAIPLAIHLFNLRRYKTVYFSDTRFLKQVQQSTKRQRKLKEWLVLLSRLLFLFFLVIAFARPFLPVGEQNKANNTIVLALDNSASMQVGLEENSPFIKAKQMALELLEQLPNQTKVALYTASGSSLNFTSPEFVVDELNKLSLVDQPFNPGKLNAALPKSAAVYWFTDLQKNNFKNTAFSDSNQWLVVPTITDDETNLANVFIDSVWIDAPILLAGQEVEFSFRVKNTANQSVDANIEISANNLPEMVISEIIPANGDTIIPATLTQLNRGFNTLQLYITNDNVDFDNRFFGSYFLPISNRVVEIYDNEPNSLIKNIFSSQEFTFTSMAINGVNNQDVQNADLIILNQPKTLSTGLQDLIIQATQTANVLIIPPNNNAKELNSLCTRLGIYTYGDLDTSNMQVLGINPQDPFFKEVFSGSVKNAYWPNTLQHYGLTSKAQLPTFNLIKLANGQALFNRYNQGQTNIFQLAISLDQRFSDITSHPIIVPLFIKSLTKANSISGFTGYAGIEKSYNLEIDELNNDQVINLSHSSYSFIPQQRINGKNVNFLAGKEIRRKGNYAILTNEQELGKMAFNLQPLESDIKRFNSFEFNKYIQDNNHANIEVLNADIATFASSFSEWQQGKQLWKFAMLLALLFILLEILLLRFLK